MALTPRQREQVENNLELIPKVIFRYITAHNDITGMEYNDLYQTGCLALCDAVLSFCPDRNACFKTYASTVIRNRLYDYCRHINHIQSHILYLDSGLAKDGEASYLDYLAAPEPEKDFTSERLFSLLLTVKSGYSGIAAKGIEALLLKAKGYTGTEIARMYRVKPNHVAAWISRANSRLRQEPCILAAFKQ